MKYRLLDEDGNKTEFYKDGIKRKEIYDEDTGITTYTGWKESNNRCTCNRGEKKCRICRPNDRIKQKNKYRYKQKIKNDFIY